MNNYVDQAISKINDRLIYADVLRVFAILAIIIVHVTSGPLYWAKPSQAVWVKSLVYDSLFNWGTLVFTMLSGLFMLKPARVENIPSFLIKRAKRILIPFLVWAIIYSFYKTDATLSFESLEEILKNIISGKVKVHLWFVYMIFGLYLITPVLSQFVNNASKQQLIYYFIFWISSLTIFPLLNKYIGDQNGLERYIELHVYSGFYMFGYIIEKYNIRINKWWFLLIPALIILKFILVYYHSLNIEATHHFYRDRLRFNVIFIPILLFFTFRQINWEKIFSVKSIVYKQIVKYSALSYGIFLSHILFIQLMNIWIPSWADTFKSFVAVVILASIVANIFNKIPVIRKLLL